MSVVEVTVDKGATPAWRSLINKSHFTLFLPPNHTHRPTKQILPLFYWRVGDFPQKGTCAWKIVADYQLLEEADVYECIDEQTYAAIAARNRKDARNFIDADIDPDIDDVDQAAYGMEREFEIEDELSAVKAPARGPEEEDKSARPSPPPLRHEVSQHEVSGTGRWKRTSRMSTLSRNTGMRQHRRWICGAGRALCRISLGKSI